MRLAVPYTDADELEEIREVLASGFYTQGPKVAEFERMVADFVGVRHAFAMSSGTTALHLALVVAGVGPGHEVLVPDFTFPATANVVVQQGATPVLVDVDLATFAVDLADLARKVTDRSKAIMPVHPFGLSANMDPVMALAREHELTVIEDAACALGTTYFDRPCGSLGDLACFSFHPRKVITTGEGGMIVTDNDAMAEQIALLRSHGSVRQKGRSVFHAAGYNYRLSDIHGAMGVAQMRKLDWMIQRRRWLAAQLSSRLGDIEGLCRPGVPEWGGHIYQSYVVLLEDPALDRDTIIDALRERGIESTLGTYALHAQPFFSRMYGYQAGDIVNSYRAYLRTLAFPFYPGMTDEEIDSLALLVRETVQVCRGEHTARTGEV